MSTADLAAYYLRRALLYNERDDLGLNAAELERLAAAAALGSTDALAALKRISDFAEYEGSRRKGERVEAEVASRPDTRPRAERRGARRQPTALIMGSGFAVVRFRSGRERRFLAPELRRRPPRVVSPSRAVVRVAGRRRERSPRNRSRPTRGSPGRSSGDSEPDPVAPPARAAA
jgi:hypothetical protein